MENDMEERKELVDNFEKLESATRADILSHVRFALLAQENTKKAMKKFYGLGEMGMAESGAGELASVNI
jgi:hypothetical protein